MTVIQKYLGPNDMKEVLSNQDYASYYLSLHAVLKPKSTTKLASCGIQFLQLFREWGQPK